MKILTAFELSQQLVHVPYNKEVHFFTDDLRRCAPWERPKQEHIIVKTHNFGDDMIIISSKTGYGTKLVSVSELSDPTNIRGIAYGLTGFIQQYLNKFNVQRVTAF